MEYNKKLVFLLNANKALEVKCFNRNDYLNPGFALVEYFNFFYYMAQCPFRFQYSEEMRRYITHTNRFQQICCIFMNICVMLNLFSYLRWYATGGSKAPSQGNPKNELLYFSIGLSFGEAVLGVSYLTMSWFYAVEFETLINYYYIYLKNFNIRRTKCNTHARKIVIVAFGIATVVCEVVTLGLNLEETATLHDADVKYLLFLDFIPYDFDSDWSKLVKKLILILTQLQYYVVYVACQTLLITGAIAMIAVLSQMERKLPRCSVEDGIDYYSRLKRLCGLNDNALNLAIFGGVFGQILALAFSVPSIFQPASPFGFLVNLMHGTVGTAYLTIAALIVTKSTSIFEDWLIGNKKFNAMSENQVAVLLYSLSQQEISISTVGLVKLTPGFLGAILGLVFTFSIVIIQFNQNKMSQPAASDTIPV